MPGMSTPGLSTEAPETELIPVAGGDDLVILKSLFVEYAEAFDHALCFEAFDRELEDLPAPYQAPDGGLVLARVNGQAAGCAALKRIDKKTAEMKRLFVRPGFRGHRLGMQLTEAMIELSKSLKYKILQVETVPTTMGLAVSLYRQNGFVPSQSSTDGPIILLERPL